MNSSSRGGWRWMAAALVLLVAACGGDGSDEPEEGSPATDPGESTSEAIDESAVLRVAYNTGPDSLDPVKQNSDPTAIPLKLVYDRLIHAEPDTSLVPGLAEEWSWVDDVTLELRLRDGVTFHDGEPLNAEAVKVNLERTMAYEDGVTLATRGLDPVASVDVVDPSTIRLNLEAPNPDVEIALAEYAGMMISPAAIANGVDLDSQAVGAGMYELDEFSPGNEISVVRYADYWDPDSVKLAGVQFMQIADADARFNALRAGQLHLTFLEPRQVGAAEQAGLEMQMADSLSVYTLLTNMMEPPIADVVVRRALSQSIDREALVEQLFYGYAAPTLQMFPPGHRGYSEDHGLDYLPYDPEAARASLEEAGYEEPPVVDVLVLNRPQDHQLFEVMQQMAAEGGIELKATVAEPAQFSEFWKVGGPVQLFLGRSAGWINSARALENYMGDGLINPGGATTEKMKGLLDQLLAMPLDDPDYDTTLQAASAEAVESMIEIPIAGLQVPWAHSGCVQDFRPYLTISDEFRGVSISKDC